VVTNGRTFLDVFGLYCKALFRDEKSTSACILFPRSSRRNLKSRLLDSNFSLIEFVRNKRSVSPLIKPFLTLRGWHEEKCVYWNVSVALKCVFDCGMEIVGKINETVDFLFA